MLDVVDVLVCVLKLLYFWRISNRTISKIAVQMQLFPIMFKDQEMASTYFTIYAIWENGKGCSSYRNPWSSSAACLVWPILLPKVYLSCTADKRNEYVFARFSLHVFDRRIKCIKTPVILTATYNKEKKRKDRDRKSGSNDCRKVSTIVIRISKILSKHSQM